MSENEVLNHDFVPEHRVLSKDESHKILKELSVMPNHLPKILNTDPVIMAIGAKIGDILEITRKSPTAGTTKYYRIVKEE